MKGYFVFSDDIERLRKTHSALHDAIVELQARLEDIAAASAEDPSDAAHRANVFYALYAVDDFLSRFQCFRDAGVKWFFERLRTALADLVEGRRPPLLADPPRLGRPKDNTGRLFVKGTAAACMSLLMRTGRTEVEAAREIANALRTLGYRVPGRADRSISGTTISKWREQVRPNDESRTITAQALKGEADVDFATYRYHGLMQTHGRYPTQFLEDEASKLMSELPDRAPSEFPKNT